MPSCWLRLPRKSSSVFVKPVELGAVFRNRRRAKSSKSMSTAREGRLGAHGNKPAFNRLMATAHAGSHDSGESKAPTQVQTVSSLYTISHTVSDNLTKQSMSNLPSPLSKYKQITCTGAPIPLTHPEHRTPLFLTSLRFARLFVEAKRSI